MKPLVKTIVTCAFFCFFVLSLADSASAYGGRVTIGSVDGSPGTVVGVPVYLGGNDIAFSAVTIPLRYSSSDLTVDSVSLIGSIIDPAMTEIVYLDPDSQYVIFSAISISAPFPTVSADSGLLATFWFSISAAATGQLIVVDSLNTVDTIIVSPPTLKFRRVEFVETVAEVAVTRVPQVKPGKVTILATGIDDEIGSTVIPETYELSQNYPNPFNPSTSIHFSLPARASVELQIFNLLGQNVSTLHSGTLPAGNHQFQWEASSYPSGVYFYRLVSRFGIQTKKMMLVK